MARAHGMDEYLWATKHIVVPASVVHHIVPIDDDESLWLRMDNLIAVTAETHNKIHSAYKRNKAEMQRRLKDIISPTLKKFW